MGDSPRPSPEPNHTPVRKRKRSVSELPLQKKWKAEVFTYGELPLDKDKEQIRVVIINPGDSEDINCELKVVDLTGENAATYKTVSYVWGDPKARQTITLNGRPAKIPGSAANVMRRVRSSDAPKTIWIDAVCIDQTNQNERSSQVALMGKIYSHGEHNLIYWCGEEEYVKPALTNIAALQREAKAVDFVSRAYTENALPTYAAKNQIKILLDIPSLLGLFSCPWIQRVWTFQEAYLARHNQCLCGTETVDLLDVLRAAAWIVHNGDWVDAAVVSAMREFAVLHKFIDVEAGQRQSLTKVSELGALATLRRRHCLHPMDKIYGALGLLPWLDVVPDYNKTTSEVYQDFAVSYARVPEPLWILNHVNHAHAPGQGHPGVSGLPSWVPDWSEPVDPKKHSAGIGSPWANNHESAVVSASKEPGGAVLSAPGILLGHIVDVTEPVADNAATFRPDKVWPLVIQAIGREGNDKDVGLAVATTLCTGLDWQFSPVQEDVVESFQAWADKLEQGINIPYASELASDETGQVVAAAQYRTTAFRACIHRRFFSTSKHYFGLGPYFMKGKDVVVILGGYRFPVVLRPHGKRFQYLGQAYVYGAMEGQAVRQHREQHGQDVIFEIC